MRNELLHGVGAASIIAVTAGSVFAGGSCCGDASCASASASAASSDAAVVQASAVEPGSLAGYEGLIAEHVAEMTFAALPEDKREMLVRFVETHEGRHEQGFAGPALCFKQGTDDRVVEAFEAVMDVLYPGRFQLTGRWSGTVASGSAGVFGEPVTLTWSFVPDGTFIPSGVGEPAGNSNLFARLDSIYGGNTAAWQAIYFECFERWGEITGINYVFEPNDDGASLFNNPGVAGVRGDLRMAGKTIDGNSGTLAYNFFPQGGDMVIDTGDNFYNDTSSNSVRLYNVLKHEHGHGMGLLHNCPITSEKLMEPFINLAFQGAQHDDIRGAHRMYGDFFEPNDNTGNATDLGTLVIGQSVNVGDLPPNGRQSVDFGSRASINSTADVDVYRLQVNEPVTLNSSVTPVGFNYQDNPQQCGGQPGSCCSGDFVNSLIEANLRIEVLNSSGAVIAVSNSAPTGQVEFLNDVQLDSPGEYFVRVSASPLIGEVQLYDLDLDIGNPGFLGLQIAAITPIPDEVDPGVVTPITVLVDPRQDTLVGGSEQLFVRTDGGAFQSFPLIPTAQANEFVAELPAFLCVDSPEFFVQAEASVSGVVTLPFGGASDPFDALVGNETVIIDGNFQVSGGWQEVQTTASDGQWELGIPVDNDRGDPPADFDGSGRCWLTDNVAGNSDVDGGFTRLQSPVYDITGGATVSWAYWLNDIPGGEIGVEDGLTVEFSFNGGSTWQVVGDYTTAEPFWRTDSVTVDEAQATNQFVIRVTATEDDPGDVLEAGFDAIFINRVECEDPVIDTCPEDVDGSGTVELADLLAVLADFGTTAPGLATDVDGSGTVDLADLLAVLAEFGNDCP